MRGDAIKRAACVLLGGLAVLAAAPAGAQSVSIISTPANGTHYVAGEHIDIRFSHAQVSGSVGRWQDTYMAIEIGDNTRQARVNSRYQYRGTTSNFRYTVVGEDYDADGITLPANSITGTPWRLFGTFGFINRNYAALTNQAAHKVIGSSAAISATRPSVLSWATLHGATLDVELTGSTFGSGAATSTFVLSATATPAISGLSLAGVSAATTTATLTLAYTGSTTRADLATLGVTVLPAAHASGYALTTGSVTIREPHLRVSTERLTLTEGGSGAYTVALGSAPATTITVTATSNNPQIAVDSDSTPLTRALTFTTQNWDTAQTVTVRALADDADAVDEWVDIAHSGFGDAPEHVLVSVDDDEATGTDYDADNDLLIEVDSLARLNALRWDLDGDGAPAMSATSTYYAAFAGAAAAERMGCPDGPDADQLPDVCTGYELAADLDFDTDGDGDVDSNDDYPNWTPIGGTYSATFDGNNRVISNLTIVDAAGSAGLFSTLSGTVRGLGLADVDVSGVGGSSTNLAPLAAELSGTAISSWASGRVHVGSTGLTRAGGLVGRVSGANSRLAASYSTASVTGAGSSASWAGGLAAVIHNGATVVACYATGLVDEGGSGSVRAGG